jgi:hypothetical protein
MNSDMTEEELKLPVRSLLIFVDETGNEDLSDPKNPTFGRGGCGCLYPAYRDLIKKPWRKLKRERLGGAVKPFHAADFEQTKPTMRQIGGINSFIARPFWRFAVMLDSRTELPGGVDAHNAVSLVTSAYVSRIVAKSDVDVVALIFEGSERSDTLVKRDFVLAAMDLKNMRGQRVAVAGSFMRKDTMEPGLEVADLIAHTAGRQRRHEMRGKAGYVPDFRQTYQHGPIPPEFMAISSMQIAEAVKAGEAVPRRDDK